MDAKRQHQQRMGTSMPERAHCAQRKSISGGGSDLFRSSAKMLGGRERATHFKKIRQEREATSGDGMYCFRRESGDDDFAGGGGGWTYHHNGINLQLHMIFWKSSIANDLEVEDYFLRKLREMTINQARFVPLLRKHLKGYVPGGRQTGITCGKYPAGVNQFTEVKVIHSGTLQYMRP